MKGDSLASRKKFSKKIERHNLRKERIKILEAFITKRGMSPFSDEVENELLNLGADAFENKRRKLKARAIKKSERLKAEKK